MNPELEDNLDVEENSDVEMSFLDHLEELRQRLIKILIGLVPIIAVCFAFSSYIIDWVLIKPAKTVGLHLQNLKPFGQVFLYIEVSIILGIIVAIPYIFYHFWQFIYPALLKKERKIVTRIVFFSSLCFLLGVGFAYFIMLPMTLKFALGFGTPDIVNQIAIDEYMNLILSTMIFSGVVFELPMISLFLTKLGLLTPEFLKKYRRHSIVALLILAALLSPGTDPVSQLILSVPLFILYEISIAISKWVVKKS